MTSRPLTTAEVHRINTVHRDLKALYTNYVAELAGKLKAAIREVGIDIRSPNVEHYVNSQFRRLTTDTAMEAVRVEEYKSSGKTLSEKVVALQVKYYYALQLKNCFDSKKLTPEQELKDFSLCFKSAENVLRQDRSVRWKINFATALSFITLIIAGVRATIYRCRYGAMRFWKSAGANVVSATHKKLQLVLDLLPELKSPSTDCSRRRGAVAARPRTPNYFFHHEFEDWNSYFKKSDHTESHFESDLKLAEATHNKEIIIDFLQCILQGVTNFEALRRMMRQSLITVNQKTLLQLVKDQCDKHGVSTELYKRTAVDFVTTRKFELDQRKPAISITTMRSDSVVDPSDLKEHREEERPEVSLLQGKESSTEEAAESSSRNCSGLLSCFPSLSCNR